MDSMLLLAHVLECSMLMPAAVMALVPVRGWLRWPARLVAAATTATIATLVALGSWVSAAMRIPTNTYLFPSLVPLFFLYIALVDLPMRKKCFCFAVAMMLSAQATLLTIYIVAPAEVANATEAFMPSSALLCLLVSFSLVALFWRTLSWKLPMLFAMRSIDAIWGWLTLCPAGAFALALWLRPINFGLVTLGRSQQMMVVLCGLLIGFVWMICHLSLNFAGFYTHNSPSRTHRLELNRNRCPARTGQHRTG